jgi:carboxyl-terminal processing protease
MIDSIFTLLEGKYVDKKKITGCIDEIKERTRNGKDKNSLENLKEALFILKDAHTKIVRKSPNDFILPLSLYFLKDKIYSVQDYKTIKKGMWLTHIDSVSFETIFNGFSEKLGYDSLSTIKNNFIEDLMFSVTEDEIELKFTDGYISTEEKVHYIKYLEFISKQTTEITKNVNMNTAQNTFTDENILYFRCFSFMDKEISTKFKNEILKKEHWKAVIIDIRNNSGGNIASARNFTSLFLNEKRNLGFTMNNKGLFEVIETTDSVDGYLEKMDQLVILCNEFTASSAEFIFLKTMKNRNEKITVIGTKTADMPDIANLYRLNTSYKLTITTKQLCDSERKKIDFKGIMPDIIVETCIDDMLNHKDSQLAYAINFIQKTMR